MPSIMLTIAVFMGIALDTWAELSALTTLNSLQFEHIVISDFLTS